MGYVLDQVEKADADLSNLLVLKAVALPVPASVALLLVVQQAGTAVVPVVGGLAVFLARLPKLAVASHTIGAVGGEGGKT